MRVSDDYTSITLLKRGARWGNFCKVSPLQNRIVYLLDIYILIIHEKNKLWRWKDRL